MWRRPQIISARLNSFVHELKSEIANLSGIPSNRQRLTLDGQVVRANNNQRLSSLGFRPNSVIVVTSITTRKQNVLT